MLDKVYLIPTYKHPFDKKLIEFEHRFRMCELLSKPFGERLIATGIEKYLGDKFGGKSYTIDTVKYCKKEWADDVLAPFQAISGSNVYGADADDEAISEAARGLAKVAGRIEGKELVKLIVARPRVVNIVVRR